MSLLVWNCYGLGNLCTRKELGEFVRAKDPSVVFIAETWADEVRLKVLKTTLLFDDMFIVPRVNRGGGLVMFWKNSIKVSVKTSSKNHIDSIIGEGSEGAWRFTGFYDEPVTHMRQESWELLRSLNRCFNLPWLVAGDFNEIVRSSEKKGGNNRSHAQMQSFREALDACGFMDEGAWRFTGFYDEPVTHMRQESWELLRSLNRCFNLPWLVAGDFNEIVRSLEKKEGNNRSRAQMQSFREALDACGFMDLGYMGSPFTWQKHFRDGHSVWERLDRGLANVDWVLKFGGSKLHHLQCTTSDHSPLWIVLDGIEPP